MKWSQLQREVPVRRPLQGGNLWTIGVFRVGSTGVAIDPMPTRCAATAACVAGASSNRGSPTRPSSDQVVVGA